jgi:hypothetical protein
MVSACQASFYASSNASFFLVARTYCLSAFGIDGARHVPDRIVACRTERTFETGANGARRLEGVRATVSGVSMVSNVRWVRRRIGSVKMRRFVWPVAESLEASRPVKAPDSHVGA